jgi:hypothetical protein
MLFVGFDSFVVEAQDLAGFSRSGYAPFLRNVSLARTEPPPAPLVRPIPYGHPDGHCSAGFQSSGTYFVLINRRVNNLSRRSSVVSLIMPKQTRVAVSMSMALFDTALSSFVPLGQLQ